MFPGQISDEAKLWTNHRCAKKSPSARSIETDKRIVMASQWRAMRQSQSFSEASVLLALNVIAKLQGTMDRSRVALVRKSFFLCQIHPHLRLTKTRVKTSAKKSFAQFIPIFMTNRTQTHGFASTFCRCTLNANQRPNPHRCLPQTQRYYGRHRQYQSQLYACQCIITGISF